MDQSLILSMPPPPLLPLSRRSYSDLRNMLKAYIASLLPIHIRPNCPDTPTVNQMIKEDNRLWDLSYLQMGTDRYLQLFYTLSIVGLCK